MTTIYIYAILSLDSKNQSGVRSNMENLNLTTTKSYTITLLTVAQLTEIARITGKNQSEIVRDAVEDLYNRIVKEQSNGHEEN